MTPKNLHRAAAGIEMFTWTLLIIAMILKYSGVTEAWVPVAGPIHGFGFLCFIVITVILWINNHWPIRLGLLGLFVSLIPWAALPFTVLADRAGRLEGGWRFRDTDEQPSTLPDHGLAQMVRHPVRTGLIVLVVIAIVFALLLTMGQPYDPDAIAETVN
ncbi:DUF3817 domain-containing protein [Corynebacterium alimapuense]|uniref:DUF3817 domain-containing protein n=1 Tax=Corynebacterium alimapuense TaxID=1576874 RepID=A0A3M8K9Y5_9CORY|nr:DUF3817 domain-containing protein [Corynebacterium alimapuense]RNE49268.1 hypothetical protein C5L39_02515 [Corynebacterium alimapuense]